MSARPLALLPLLALAAHPGGAPQEEGMPRVGRGLLAVKAGTIHLVEDGRVLDGGAILIKDGRILAVGSELEIPVDAELVDYGPDAVIVPGLVAAFSPYALGSASDRTADVGLSALDGYDPYRVYADALSAGVTSAYLTPAEGRLLAGMGAVVKLGGERGEGRVLNPRAALHGAIDQNARNTPGYWEPPVPVAVDVELGYARPQLPDTTMSAVVALEELLAFARDPADPELRAEYGPRLGAELARALAARVPLRLGAVTASETRALLDFARRNEVPLILDRATGAAALADEIAAAGVPVVFRLPYWPNADAFDRGKGEDDRWPSFDVPAALVRAGVSVAITSYAPRDLRFAAQLASRGGLERAAALRSVTLTPAELLRSSDRVGSLRAGKDADLCVLNGDPLAPTTSVLATWIDGKLVWKAHESARATVIEADELHLGDGRILRPGQLLMQGGRIREVGQRVSHPVGALVTRAQACMPGMIDALGHLGLEGSRKVPSTDFEMSALIAPGDTVDRKVALNGITTVVLGPSGASDSGAPLMAYKPAATSFEHQIVGDLVAVRVSWSESNVMRTGEKVRALLEKARKYREDWVEYEKALAAWTPPPEAAVEPAEAEKKDEDEAGADEKKAEEAPDAKESDSKDKKEDSRSKRKKGKKDEPEELEPDPVTGAWKTAKGEEGPSGALLSLRLSLAESGVSAAVEGNLRCEAASRTLVEVRGWLDRESRTLTLEGVGSRGWISFTATFKEAKLEAALTVAGETLEAVLERTSREYVVARLPERKPVKESSPKPPKGKPREPKLDAKLEPLRRAMEGRGTVVVDVDRAVDILPCVEAFAEVGIRPVLLGAREAYLVADRIADRVAGILLDPAVVVREAKRGTDDRRPYADLQNAGIPVAFRSDAEEGAIDLPLRAAYAVANGMSPEGALRALTLDAATMMGVADRIGRLERGLDADVLLLDGAPLDPATSVLRVWVNGEEVEAP